LLGLPKLSILLKNIKFNFIGQTVSVLLSFIGFKLIYQYYGKDGLGIVCFSLFLSTLFASVVDVGLSKTTIREISGHYSDTEYITKLSQTFFLFYLSSYTFAVVVFVLCLPGIVNSWINLSTMDSQLAQHVLLILGVTSLLAIPKTYLASIFVGLQRMDINNNIDISFVFLQQIGIICLLLNGYKIIVVSCWIAIINIFRVVLYMFFVSRFISIKAVVPKWHPDVFFRIKKYTAKMMWVSLLLVIHKQLDKVLISKFLPIGHTGIYSIANTTISKTSIVTGAVAQAVFPLFSELINKDQLDKSLRKFFIIQEFLVFGTLPIFAFVIFFSTPLFTFVLDSQAAKDLQVVVILLCVYYYFNAIMRVVRAYIFAKGKPESAIKADIISLIFLTPLTFFLVYNMGINGAALSSVIYYIIMAICIIPKEYSKEFLQPPKTWLYSVVTAVFIACIAYIPLGLLAHNYYSNSIQSLLICYILSTLLYAVIAINLIGEDFQKLVLGYLPGIRALIIVRHDGHKRRFP